MVSNANHKRAVRARMAETGESYMTAARAITEEKAARPLRGRRSVAHPDGIPWWELIGVRVKADEYNGVVLPPTPAAPDVLRLALLDGRVLTFDPATFDVSPMPAESFAPPKGSKRKVREYGKPIYRYGEIPDGVLATMTMLGHLRRQLPADLLEVAYFLGGKSEYFPLYPVADCPPMPELPPRRRAAWEAARTCGWCAATRPHPWPKSGENGNVRLCGECSQSARDQRNTAAMNADRLVAEAHVRALLADPSTVVVCVQKTWHLEERSSGPYGGLTGSCDRHVTVVDNSGHLVGVYEYTRHWIDGQDVTTDEHTLAEMTRLHGVLAGKRMLSADFDDPRQVGFDFHAANLQLEARQPWEGPGIDPKLGDQFWWITSAAGLRWPKWERPAAGTGNLQLLRDAYSYRTWFGEEPPAEAAVMYWRMLHMIATGRSGAPVACPWRASHLEPACGSPDISDDGLCDKHHGSRTQTRR